MSTDRLYRTEGIVIRRRNQGEADRVLTLYTPLGKMEVIAKGARKLRSRKAGHIELFSHTRLLLARGRTWDIVSQAEMIEAHRMLRGDLLRGTYARYAVELLDRFVALGEGGLALFDLLNHTLSWLCQDEDLDLIARFYEVHLLGLVGFRPELFRCVACGATLRFPELAEQAESLGFDPDRGGVVCASCRMREGNGRGIGAISLWALKLLRVCQSRPYETVRRMRVRPALHEETERVMRGYITYHLERGVKSGTFLRQLRREQRYEAD